jgi:hypothetical protein
MAKQSGVGSYIVWGGASGAGCSGFHASIIVVVVSPTCAKIVCACSTSMVNRGGVGLCIVSHGAAGTSCSGCCASVVSATSSMNDG